MEVINKRRLICLPPPPITLSNLLKTYIHCHKVAQRERRLCDPFSFAMQVQNLVVICTVIVVPLLHQGIHAGLFCMILHSLLKLPLFYRRIAFINSVVFTLYLVPLYLVNCDTCKGGHLCFFLDLTLCVKNVKADIYCSIDLSVSCEFFYF